MRFRKKPVVVEAERLTWDNWSTVCAHAGVGKLAEGRPEGCYLGRDGKQRIGHEATDRLGLLIPTLEGVMTAAEGDWIIRGVKGELYPCKPDIFAATYEPDHEAQPLMAALPPAAGRVIGWRFVHDCAVFVFHGWLRKHAVVMDYGLGRANCPTCYPKGPFAGES